MTDMCLAIWLYCYVHDAVTQMPTANFTIYIYICNTPTVLGRLNIPLSFHYTGWLIGIPGHDL